jgi:hypothetical protein
LEVGAVERGDQLIALSVVFTVIGLVTKDFSVLGGKELLCSGCGWVGDLCKGGGVAVHLGGVDVVCAVWVDCDLQLGPDDCYFRSHAIGCVRDICKQEHGVACTQKTQSSESTLLLL